MNVELSGSKLGGRRLRESTDFGSTSAGARVAEERDRLRRERSKLVVLLCRIHRITNSILSRRGLKKEGQLGFG